ncbi:hypothetical protein [Streptomyces sp. NBC_01353]|uniref:hypothetical protein n=1 Tax=Streptomyces sp. NBC_01353 TaxID=2903835 RepID=UPI002E350AB7|nr:hypothetical protein [Streptomyces sp. NBC_01353]
MTDEQRDAALKRSLRATLLASSAATSDEPAGREAEAGALAAFRAARDAGLHGSGRTSPRDDWTPSARQRNRRHPLKTAVAALLASVTLGGVAIAAGDLPGPFPGAPAPAPEPRRSSFAPSTSPAIPENESTLGIPDRTDGPVAPPTSKDRDVLCHANEKSAHKDKTGESKSWRRLVRAAGGEEHVPAYCGQAHGPGHEAGAGIASEKGKRAASPQIDANSSEQPKPAHPLGKPRPDKP